MPTTATTSPSTAAKAQVAAPVIGALNLYLADLYALMALTHHAHWNVEGPDFFSLHKAFQEQYEHAFELVDDVAERVRALDAYAIGGLRSLAQESGIAEFPVGPLPAKDFVAGLIVAQEKNLTDAISLRDASGAINDLETQDLAIGNIQWHQKTLWMLKSYLKAL